MIFIKNGGKFSKPSIILPDSIFTYLSVTKCPKKPNNCDVLINEGRLTQKRTAVRLKSRLMWKRIVDKQVAMRRIMQMSQQQLILSWSAGPGSSLKGTVFLVAAIVNVWGEKNHLSTMCRALLRSCSSSSIK